MHTTSPNRGSSARDRCVGTGLALAPTGPYSNRMLLWIGFAAMTAAVVAALLQPFRRPAAPPLEAEAADLAIYRHQLSELEAERERGLFNEEEAAGARVEVARRLIRHAGAGDSDAPSTKDEPSPQTPQARTLLYAIAVLIPLLSIGTYLWLGAPALEGQPYAARQGTSVENASVAELVGRIETRLREHPDDGKGWDVVAPVYLRLGRYDDAAKAYAHANRLLGETPERLIGFAEAALLAGNGVVSQDVRRAAERILELEPGRAEPRVWLALAKEQDGDLPGAASAYRELIAGAPADAPWRNAVSDRLDEIAKRMAGEAPAPSDAAPPGGMSELEQAEMIDRMVEGLAARLKQDGRDLEGWLKLVRAYKVLGREGEAVAALSEARRNFEGDRKSLDAIDELAKGLGLGS